MATIDLTAPEVDLPKARELLHKALDLLERNDDAAPPSDARTLALKVLGAKTLPEAQGLAQALIDAEDQPAAKRRRSNSNSPQRAAHEKAYNDLIEAVRKLLDQLCFPAFSFDAAAKLFAKAEMAATPWCARKELPFSYVKGCMNNGVFLDAAYKSDQFNERLLSGNVAKLLSGENVAKLDLPRGGFANQMTLAVLLDPEQFAKIQPFAGDGRVGQAFFKACAAWAWALLKKEHDPTFPKDSDDE